MKVVMTLLVRDEADVIDAQIAYHLNAGVDFVIATDHRSVDETTEILESYAREGYLQLIREDGKWIRQSEWVTRMARLAASEHQADWVINSDADEFWWPREGTLKEILASVPAMYGVVRGFLQYFPPRPGRGWFAERMTMRLALPVALNDPGGPFRPAAQVAHRGNSEIVVAQGNHTITGVQFATPRNWHPLEILHFPFRSPEQCARKHRNTLEAWERNLRGDLVRARTLLEQDRPEAFYDRVVVGDRDLGRGLASGLLVEDTRLRDALRAVRDGSGRFQRQPVGDERVPSRRSLAEDAAYAAEVLSLADADLVRAQRRVDELERRVAQLEPRSSTRRRTLTTSPLPQRDR